MSGLLYALRARLGLNGTARQAPLNVVIASRSLRADEALRSAGAPVRVRDARSTRGALEALESAHLVILDCAGPDAIPELEVSYRQLLEILDRNQVPHATTEDFLARPEEFLARARARTGAIEALPRRTVAVAAYSGGLGKTTLSLHLARYVARQTRLPVAVLEFAYGASAFQLFCGRDAPLPTLFELVQQGRRATDGDGAAAGELRPGAWHDVAVVPMASDTALMLRPADIHAWFVGGGGYPGLRNDVRLAVIDVHLPHTLLSEARLLEEVDHVLIPCTPRPDTVQQAWALRGELQTLPHPPAVSVVLNQAHRGEALVLGQGRFDAVIGVDERAEALDGRLGAPLAALVYPHTAFGRRAHGSAASPSLKEEPPSA